MSSVAKILELATWSTKLILSGRGYLSFNSNCVQQFPIWLFGNNFTILLRHSLTTQQLISLDNGYVVQDQFSCHNPYIPAE